MAEGEDLHPDDPVGCIDDVRIRLELSDHLLNRPESQRQRSDAKFFGCSGHTIKHGASGVNGTRIPIRIEIVAQGVPRLVWRQPAEFGVG